MTQVKIAVAGASGRMGRMLIEATLKDEGAVLAAAFDRHDSAVIGKNAGELVGLPSDVLVTGNAREALAKADCLIDFTRPEGTLEHLRLCRELGVALVIGTTGFEEAGKAEIQAAAQDIPVVFAPNMAVGVNVVFKLLDLAGKYSDTAHAAVEYAMAFDAKTNFDDFAKFAVGALQAEGVEVLKRYD